MDLQRLFEILRNASDLNEIPVPLLNIKIDVDNMRFLTGCRAGRPFESFLLLAAAYKKHFDDRKIHLEKKGKSS